MDRRLVKQFSPSDAGARSGNAAAEIAAENWPTRWLIEYSGLEVERSWLERYGTALGAVAVAALVRLLLDPYLDMRVPYGFFLIATAFVAWRCGLLPAVMTVCMGAIFARYYFEAPRGSFGVEVSPSNVSLIISLAIGLVTAFFCESLRSAAQYNAHLYHLARQADARKDEFLATLAHELRNPLAPISNALYLLDKVEPKDPRVSELREMISCQTEHLIHLVGDLLDVSRITQGKVELQIEKVELRNVIDTAMDVVRPLINEKGHEIQVTLPSSRIFLNADKVRLTQVMTNLLNNAAKYTDKGGMIWVSADVEENHVIVRVSDTGIGIATENQVRIFELFQQASHAIEQAQGGLGIGLTLVRRLVEMHGGTVCAESPGLGLGSKFTVRLPIAQVDFVEDEPAVDKEEIAKNDCAPLKILVVDDLPAITSSLATLLRFWNHEVEIGRDGFTSLEIARAFKPDVILTDLGLPRMSGYQFAEEVRRIPGLSDVALIAISGYGQESDLKKSKAAGFGWHFVKPIDLTELERVLSNLKPRNVSVST